MEATAQDSTECIHDNDGVLSPPGARATHLVQAVMSGAEAADRGDVIDGESAIDALSEKINTWRNKAF